MGFVLSVLYFVTNYLTPTVLFGPLAAYRIELILAMLIALVSLFQLKGSIPLKTPQSLALIGLAIAVLMSIAVGAGWIGGGIPSLLLFIPNAFGYFLVCLHCNSKRKLQVLVGMLVLVCLFVMVNGAMDLRRGIPEGPPISPQSGSVDYDLWNADHPYLYPMENETGQWFYRVRGLGLISDPNDFGQLLACVIPLLLIYWRPKKKFWNLAFVIVPICLLLLGIYLTHSRGALIALAVVALLLARRRIGTIPAVLLACAIFAATMELQFAGGRDISISAGSDRTALWGASLQLLKTHLVFGVGFGNLPDYLGLTAHNSVAVCAAELGLFGLFFWCLFLFPTLRDAIAVASPGKVSEGETTAVEAEPVHGRAKKSEAIDKIGINHLGRMMVLSLAGFLAAGIFLSRAFVMTLFVLGGMTEVVYGLALDRKMIAPRMRLARAAMYSAIMAASLMIILYVGLRTVNMAH